MENKQAICNELCKVLQMTRDGAEIEHIEYYTDGNAFECAIVHYRSGFIRNINVATDSGMEMVKDIMKNV